MRKSRIIALLAVGVIVVVAAPFVSHIIYRARFYGHVDHVAATIRSFDSRRPSDVPEEQWKSAVDWTANVIYQDFFAPTRTEFAGLEKLSRGLDQRARGEIDLGTLRWIWDECENACGGPDSYGIRFRNVKLLTKGMITDTCLPEVWSLPRCTGLDLSGTEITDASVSYLSTLTQVERLDIRDTRITAEGAEELQKELPKCKVFH